MIIEHEERHDRGVPKIGTIGIGYHGCQGLFVFRPIHSIIPSIAKVLRTLAPRLSTRSRRWKPVGRTVYGRLGEAWWTECIAEDSVTDDTS